MREQSRKEGFLVEMGHSEELGSIQGDEEGKENDQSEGRVEVGRRGMGAQRWCARTSHLNHVHFFVGHFA